MSAVARLTFVGLEQLKRDLRNLPTELREEAKNIVLDTANAAATEIRSAYPSRKGRLRNGITARLIAVGPYGSGAMAQNRARHAYLYEYGTVPRQTSKGWNRGRMPEANPPIFVPKVIRHRRAMYQKLKDLLTRKGLKVSGDA